MGEQKGPRKGPRSLGDKSKEKVKAALDAYLARSPDTLNASFTRLSERLEQELTPQTRCDAGALEVIDEIFQAIADESLRSELVDRAFEAADAEPVSPEVQEALRRLGGGKRARAVAVELQALEATVRVGRASGSAYPVSDVRELCGRAEQAFANADGPGRRELLGALTSFISALETGDPAAQPVDHLDRAPVALLRRLESEYDSSADAVAHAFDEFVEAATSVDSVELP
jgi:hypothetical protein